MNYQSRLGEAALIRWGFIDDERIYNGSFWGLITNAFVHIEPIHLIFNLYWFWIFGKAFERTFGSIRLLLFILVAAAITSGLQLFEGSGIGLSGVGYALFGFGWVGRTRYPEFARVVTQRTISLFVIWGIACIFLTYAHVMNIGNVAHFTGLAFGAAICALTEKPRYRYASGIALVLMVCGSVGALFWNPRSLYWVAKEADKAVTRRDYDRAEELYLSTQNLGANPQWTWLSLGELYGAKGDKVSLQRAINELKRIDPENAEYLSGRFENLLKDQKPDVKKPKSE